MDSTWPYELDQTSAGLIDHQANQYWHGIPHHSLDMQQAIRADELEQRIFQHPDIHAHYGIVELYLKIDEFTLQSIYHLREKNDFCKELAKHHNSFFESPPKDLFKLIYDLRLFKDYSVSETLGRLEASRKDPQKKMLKPVIRTAQEGYIYKCPSEKCRKTFKKAGHARNHVENQHAEYLKLYPGWEPQQHLVSSSGSRSPESDRHQADESDGEQFRHRRHAVESSEMSRPRIAKISTTTSETSNINSISPRSLVFSSSSCDGDTESRRNSRVSPLLPMTPLGLDMSSTIPYYPQQISPTLKRVRSPGPVNDTYMCFGAYNSYTGSRHSTRHDETALGRREHYKMRR